MNATLDSVYLEGRKLEQELTAERALADRLAGIIQKDRDGHGGMVTDDKCNCEDCEHLRPIDDALVAWKEARNV